MALEARLARLEAEAQIGKLVSRYFFHLDNHEVDLLAGLFTSDCSLDMGGRTFSGRDAAAAQYRRILKAAGPSFHAFDGAHVDLAGDGAEAVGWVSAHAELCVQGATMLVALRYMDTYRIEEGEWRIAKRAMKFFYYVPLAEYPGILAGPDRNLASGTPSPADFPERLESWIALQSSHDDLPGKGVRA